jgi:hypothetical protein
VKPPPTISAVVRAFSDRVCACRVCAGPVLPLTRRDALCADCRAWADGIEPWATIAADRAAAARRARRIDARRSVVRLAVEATRADLIDY